MGGRVSYSKLHMGPSIKDVLFLGANFDPLVQVCPSLIPPSPVSAGHKIWLIQLAVKHQLNKLRRNGIGLFVIDIRHYKFLIWSQSYDYFINHEPPLIWYRSKPQHIKRWLENQKKKRHNTILIFLYVLPYDKRKLSSKNQVLGRGEGHCNHFLRFGYILLIFCIGKTWK